MGLGDRYLRQTSLSEIGVEGQDRIRNLRILVVGAGGLGTPAAVYLAAAGVGHLCVVDPDAVELSNLQRQVLYRDEDIGAAKAPLLAGRLAEINHDVSVDAIKEKYNTANAEAITSGFDVVIGATDSFESRMTIARTCAKLGTPYVYGGINRFEVQAMSVMPGKTCCYGCLYGDAFDGTEERQGPIGAVAGIGGTIQAVEALKIGAGFGEPLYNRLLMLDALNMNARLLPAARRAGCEVCGFSG